MQRTLRRGHDGRFLGTERATKNPVSRKKKDSSERVTGEASTPAAAFFSFLASSFSLGAGLAARPSSSMLTVLRFLLDFWAGTNQH